MLGQDLISIAKWWVMLFTLGLIFIPLSYLIFKKFTDIGYAFSKIIAILVPSYVLFLLSALKILPFERFSIFSIIFVFLLLNIKILLKKNREIFNALRKSIKFIIFQELFFTLGFVFWSFVRTHQPDINGLEKFMDYGFINSILRTRFLPPQDMWFAGKPINYYWFGHLVTSTLTRLSEIPQSITYNLMLATILGFTLSCTFSIVTTLIKNLESIKNPKAVIVGGLISSILLTFAGNFHTPLYALKEGKEKYWYPDATRFIGYHPETNDKTIHEFPIYSFVVSDLHPHLLNLPFVLLYIALLANLALYQQGTRQYLKFKLPKNLVVLNLIKGTPSKFINIILETLPLGFLLGVFFMTNTWDFGNYLIVTFLVLLIFSIRKVNIRSLYEVIARTILIIFIGVLTSLPFLLNFESIAKGIGFVMARTPIWQLAILWGFPAILTLIFLFTIKNYRNLEDMNSSDLFVISLLISSWLLILLPEVFYVKDIYIASYHRANTMFKLTYQAFVMFYLSSGYIFVKTINELKVNFLKILAALLFSILSSSILWYAQFAINSYYGKLKIYYGLDGEGWLSKRYPDTYNLISWFRENVKNQPTILEAPGDSYTEFNVISSYTGLPTPSGWFVHEWLWRGSPEIPAERIKDIQQIYTSKDKELTKNLLKKYNIEYVIVGPFEYQKFPTLDLDKFSQIGEVVFSSQTTSVYKILF